MNPKTLYLCYFGLREPLVQTQVLPYLREIVKDGIKVFLLTFEQNPNKNWSPEQVKTAKSNLEKDGIYWNFLTYHKRPSAPATLFDILNGAWFSWRLNRREKIDVFHGRVHTPTAMGYLAKKFSFGKKPKVLFDVRGFFPEEYVDAGNWKKDGWLYKAVKKIEKRLFEDSDGFVVLTQKAQEILFPESRKDKTEKSGKPVEIIPCCVDLKRFENANEISRAAVRKKYNLENRTVLAYVGSFGGWYLSQETADFLGIAKKFNPNIFAMILTHSPPEIITKLLTEKGFTESDFLVTKVSPSEIPTYLSGADIALSFIKPSYSKQASSPTKIAEYLACGLPIISNSEIGDLDSLIEENNVGAIVREFNEKSYLEALHKAEKMRQLPDFLTRCKQTAQENFDLENVGGRKYRHIYKRLLDI